MPYINYRFSNEDHMEFAVMPKGAGSENMSALAMLIPSQGLKGIKEFALNTVVNAGGKPVPPHDSGHGYWRFGRYIYEAYKRGIASPNKRSPF